MDKYTVLKTISCPHCDGGGVYTRTVRSSYDGKPRLQDFDCESCHGAGKIQVEVPLEVALAELGIVMSDGAAAKVHVIESGKK